MQLDDLISHVTADLIAAIEAGADEWRMPWHTIAITGQPRSIDHRPYRALNSLLLAWRAAERGWTSATWGTYLSWQRHGAQVRRGERATQVVLWKQTTTMSHDDDTEQADDAARRRLVSRVFSVFAAEQVDGADPELTARDTAIDTSARIADADAYFDAIGADVVTGGNDACYVAALDRIYIPHLEQFDRPALYYSTLAHEHTHRTGHPSRLNRDLTGRFGSDAYAVEELIAELGAAYWCAQAGLSPAARHDHASYLRHWVRVLREQPRVLLTVTARAQAALDHLNRDAGTAPPPAEATDHEATSAAA
jgi:antirestriction protein ArdC